MLLYKKLLLVTFGTTLVYYRMIHGPYSVKNLPLFYPSGAQNIEVAAVLLDSLCSAASK